MRLIVFYINGNYSGLWYVEKPAPLPLACTHTAQYMGIRYSLLNLLLRYSPDGYGISDPANL